MPGKVEAGTSDFRAGKIDAAALKAVEDEAIVDLVHKHWSAFHGEAAMIDDTYLTGKVSLDTHPLWSTSSLSRRWRMKTAS